MSLFLIKHSAESFSILVLLLMSVINPIKHVLQFMQSAKSGSFVALV